MGSTNRRNGSGTPANGTPDTSTPEGHIPSEAAATETALTVAAKAATPSALAAMAEGNAGTLTAKAKARSGSLADYRIGADDLGAGKGDIRSLILARQKAADAAVAAAVASGTYNSSHPAFKEAVAAAAAVAAFNSTLTVRKVAVLSPVPSRNSPDWSEWHDTGVRMARRVGAEGDSVNSAFVHLLSDGDGGYRTLVGVNPDPKEFARLKRAYATGRTGTTLATFCVWKDDSGNLWHFTYCVNGETTPLG